MTAYIRPSAIHRRRRLAGLVVVGSLVVAGLATGSLAIFTDQQVTTSDDFYAGTIALTLDAGTSWATSFGSNGLNQANDIKPGDSVGPIALHVQNTGNNNLRYAVESSITGSAILAGAIQVTVKLNTAVANDCSTQGATLYTGDMDAVSSAAPMSAVIPVTAPSPRAQANTCASRLRCRSTPPPAAPSIPSRTTLSRTRPPA